MLGRGGAERVIVNLANMFTCHHDVVFVTQLAYSNEYTMNDKIKRLNMDTRNKAPFGIDPFFIYRTSKLRKVLKQEMPDVIITFLLFDCKLIYRSKLFLRIPLIISNSNNPYVNLSRIRLKTCLLYTLVDGCVFKTEKAKSFFPLKIQKKSIIINNLVDYNLFNITADKRDNIIGVGRLNSGKSWDIAIKAYSLLSDKITEKFYIYGEGEEYNRLNEYINELNLTGRVILAGITDDIAKIVANAKLFLFSSKHEGLPNALIEALITGTPCISTKFSGGGAEKLIDSGTNGILVPVDDFESMAEAMLKILTDRNYADMLARNAKEKAWKEYNPKNVYEQWEIYIKSVLRKKRCKHAKRY